MATKKIYNDFLGNIEAGKTVYFLGMDSQEKYAKNITTKSSEWVYHKRPISYIYNSNGHRSAEIDDVVDDQYILFVGCSYTFGTGLALEDTYAHILSNKLDKKYYNLSLNATGDDVIHHNLVTWSYKVKQPPLALILQWSFIGRVITHKENDFLPYGPWTGNRDYHNFLYHGEKINYFAAKRLLNRRQIHGLYNCPIIELTAEKFYKIEARSTSYSDFSIPNEIALQDFVDRARDDSHGGIETNKLWAEQVYQRLTEIR